MNKLTSSGLTRALKAIRDADPDGGHSGGSIQMLHNHKDWAIRTYGLEVWKTYMATSWDKPDNWDNECEGHESLKGEDMGESVYCDGSCVTDNWGKS